MSRLLEFGEDVADFLKSRAARLLPKRKTLIRSLIASGMAMMPMLLLLTIRFWKVGLVTWAAIGYGAFKLGLGEEVTKQLRWAKRLSAQGPIFWALARAERATIRVARAVYGDRLDKLPLQPTALACSKRSSMTATVQWITTLSSRFSVET